MMKPKDRPTYEHGQVRECAALPEFPVPAPPPLLPYIAAETPPYPGVQLLEPRLDFRHANVGVPPLEVLSQVLHNTQECDATCPAGPLTDLLLERLQGFDTHLAAGSPPPREREAQKRPVPGAVHRALGRIDRELQASLHEPRHTGPYALAGS
jgi:hypothetical protein